MEVKQNQTERNSNVTGGLTQTEPSVNRGFSKDNNLIVSGAKPKHERLCEYAQQIPRR